MSDFISKLSSYNFLNYLLPGILFVVLADKFTRFSFIQSDIIIGIFLYYFIGMIISRIGSLVVEPLLKKIPYPKSKTNPKRKRKFLEPEPYQSFIRASKQDSKIEILSETNNTYRSICTALLAVLSLRTIQAIEEQWPALASWNMPLLTIGLLIIMLFSYRKQTDFVTKRIRVHREDSNDD